MICDIQTLIHQQMIIDESASCVAVMKMKQQCTLETV